MSCWSAICGSGSFASLPRAVRQRDRVPAIEGSLGGKWVELLKEDRATVTRVALRSTRNATYAEYYMHPFKVAAASLAGGDRALIHDSSESESVVIQGTQAE